MIRVGWSKIFFCLVVGGATILGANTIQIDEATSATTCEIQGNGFVSPLLGEHLSVQGVVTLDLDQSWQRGFYLQHADCDGQADTSDGLFVYLGEQGQAVDMGDWVEVSGRVGEYYGLTEIISSPGQVIRISHDHPLPQSVSLDPPFDDQLARAYYESLEGMITRLEHSRVVGPTDGDDRTWVVRNDLELDRVFFDDPRGTGEVVCVDDGGLFEIAPEAKVTDQLWGLVGILDFRGGEYCLELTTLPGVAPGQEWHAVDIENRSFSLATFNLANLFDTVDDDGVEDDVLGPTEYQRRLHKRALAIQAIGSPDILAVQEAENMLVLQDLISQPEVQATYEVLLENGPDRRGLDVGLLFRPDRFVLVGWQVQQACTTLVDGLGPDGNGDVLNPHNEITCDMDGDGFLDGNRLFSRPPLVVHLRLITSALQDRPSKRQDVDSLDLWVIVNHWKSKLEDTKYIEYTLPRRLEQACRVSDLLDEILKIGPHASLIIAGDLNDHPGSEPLNRLTSQGLVDLLARVEHPDRYTTVYHGLSQTLDHLLLSPQFSVAPDRVVPLHVNADYPYAYLMATDSIHRSSDHDPVLAIFQAVPERMYLPLITR